MKKYRGWLQYPVFLSDCQQAAEQDVLVTPPVAAAILSYSKVHIRRLLDQEHITAWAWYEEDKFHASEVFVSSRSLALFGLRKKRLGPYDSEKSVQAVLDPNTYELLRQTAAAESSS